MNTGKGDRRRWRRAWPHRAGVLAVMACIALLTVACGGSSSSTGSSGTPNAGATPASSQQAVAFAQCMRAHGVTRFPDPGAVSGPIDSSQLGVSDSQYQAAKSACNSVAPSSGQHAALSTAQEQNVLAQLLTFAKCMRSHGVPDFPDPNAASTIWGGSGGMLFNVPSSINPNSPQFTTAENACKSLMPSSGEIRGK
jgi:hypothetical protein